MKIITRYILGIIVLSFLASCGNNDKATAKDILVQVGTETLSSKELRANMPLGLSSSDSTKFARAYIRSWIDSKLVGEIAARNIGDIDRIDQLVEEYRNDLIMWEYRQRMYESHADKTLSSDSINAYYLAHKQDFKTSTPYIKGIYIKVPEDSPNINKLKKWYCSGNASCGNNDKATAKDILVQVGTETLSSKELRANMPLGLSSSDSTKFARAYIRSWIDSKLVGEIAARNIGDIDRIDQLVEEYRNDLIMWEYRQRMYESHADKTLSSDSINAYYLAHKQDFKTSTPYIKGIYIKVPEDSPNINKLKKWYCSGNASDIEQIEKQGLSEAIHYDYFIDRWVEWEQIESRIPYDFGNNANAFVSSHKKVETTIGGFTYLLYISDYLKSGSEMPVEVATQQIKDILINKNRIEYDKELRQQLYEQGVKDGDIKILCDLES